MLPLSVDNENTFYQAYIDKGLASLAKAFSRDSNSLKPFQKVYFYRCQFICKPINYVVWILAIELTSVEQGLVKRFTKAFKMIFLSYLQIK